MLYFDIILTCFTIGVAVDIYQNHQRKEREKHDTSPVYDPNTRMGRFNRQRN